MPPYRTGGLTKYATDLMISQQKMGHEIFLLYPGQINLFGKEKISENKNFKGIWVFELVNPLPVPLRGGVINPTAFMKPLSNQELFKDFLNSINPDVIHVHTLMGIHCEFFDAANNLGIKTVFTTHDYFGICPTVNLFKYDSKACIDYDEGLGCAICNSNSYSLPLIRIMQSHLYKQMKNSSMIKSIRSRRSRVQFSEPNTLQEPHISKPNLLQYRAQYFRELRMYYGDILRKIDLVLYNSSTTKEEYEHYYSLKGKVIPVTSYNIKDNRQVKKYDENSILHITYFGPLEKYKGFFMLCDALKILLDKGVTNWELNVYGNGSEISLKGIAEHVKYHGRYQFNQQGDIFEHSDLVIVPSLWKETFGLVALESLSYGVPIIISKLVGAKDFVQNNDNGFIVEPNAECLTQVFARILNNRNILSKMNNNICSGDFDFSIENHVKRILDTYKYIEKDNSK
nr:glycosyltransferase [Sporolactobacillus sp. STSJ-5]